MKTKYFYSTLLCCAAFAAPAAANAANGTTEDRLAASLLKSKTPCVVNIKFGGHVGQDINDCFTHRVLGENTEELVEPFRHKKEKNQWQTEFWGKWMLGAVDMYRYTHSRELYDKMRASVDEIIATQQPDGYIGNYAPEHRLKEWDVWGRKYVVRGLLAWYDISGDKNALKAARKETDCLIEELKEKNKKIVETGNYRGMASASILNAVVKLYKATDDEKYLDYAKQIVDDIESPQGPQLIRKALAGNPVAERFPYPASWYSYENGHKAYEMMSCYEGLLDLYKITGDENLFKAAKMAVDNIVDTEINIAGSGSAHECWYGGKALQTRPTFHTMETCVTTTWLQILNRLRAMTGESRYSDLMEQTIYNALAASLKSDASRIAKYMPLEGVHTPGEQQCGMTTNCCNANGPRGFALVSQTAYTVKPSEITANFYVPSTATINIGNKKCVTLEQTGDYPKDDAVEIKVMSEKAEDFALKLRIPSWSNATTVSVNGTAVDGVRPGTFLAINRTWKSGDVVSIRFDMNPRVVQQDNCEALMWGPVVLARDSRFNDGFVDEAVTVSRKDGRVELKPAEAPEWAWICFKAPMVVGLDEIDHGKPRDVLFCDFGSAGNTWNPKERYRVWLPKALDVHKKQ